jgi:hypothetical protein
MTLMDLKPWDVEPELTRERLVWIARRFAAVRMKAREAHESEEGDGKWGFGCRCYERQMFAIIEASRSGDRPWLTLQNATKKFVFRVGSIPMRFYKGRPGKLRPNLRESFDELRQRNLPLGMSMLLPSMGAAALGWCIAVETDGNGLVSRVTVAAHSGEETELVLSYEIPFDEADSGGLLTPFPPPPPPPPAVPIPSPSVSAPVEKKKTSDDTEGND